MTIDTILAKIDGTLSPDTSLMHAVSRTLPYCDRSREVECWRCKRDVPLRSRAWLCHERVMYLTEESDEDPKEPGSVEYGQTEIFRLIPLYARFEGGPSVIEFNYWGDALQATAESIDLVGDYWLAVTMSDQNGCDFKLELRGDNQLATIDHNNDRGSSRQYWIDVLLVNLMSETTLDTTARCR